MSGEATVLLLSLILLLVIGWIYLLWRLQQVDARVARLESGSRDTPPSGPPEVVPLAAERSRERSREEWEALLGGDWLNKAGIFVLVVGIALALGYSFTRIGPGDAWVQVLGCAPCC